MKRNSISRGAAPAFVIAAMLAAVVQPAHAAPRRDHRVAAAQSGGWLEKAVFWIGSFLIEKGTSGVVKNPPPPPPPPPTNGGSGGGGGFGGGPFGGSCIDPSGQPVNCNTM